MANTIVHVVSYLYEHKGEATTKILGTFLSFDTALQMIITEGNKGVQSANEPLIEISSEMQVGPGITTKGLFWKQPKYSQYFQHLRFETVKKFTEPYDAYSRNENDGTYTRIMSAGPYGLQYYIITATYLQ